MVESLPWLRLSWFDPGDGAGQFRLVHGLAASGFPQDNRRATSSATAGVKLSVDSLPPRSPVRVPFAEEVEGGVLDGGGDADLAELVEEQDKGEEDGGGVGEVLAGDVGGRAVGGVEEGDSHQARGVEAQVGAGADAERAGQAAGHVGEEVAVFVQDEHELVAFGEHDDLGEHGVEQLDRSGALRGTGRRRPSRRSSKRPSVAFWIVYLEELVTDLPVLRARVKV